MKVKLVPTLISLGISALAGYGFYAANSGEPNAGCWIMLAVCSVAMFVTLTGGFGIKYGENASSVNITVLSVIFAIVHVVINLIATFAPFRTAPYVVSSGIALLLYIGIVYAMSKSL